MCIESKKKKTISPVQPVAKYVTTQCILFGHVKVECHFLFEGSASRNFYFFLCAENTRWSRRSIWNKQPHQPPHWLTMLKTVGVGAPRPALSSSLLGLVLPLTSPANIGKKNKLYDPVGVCGKMFMRGWLSSVHVIAKKLQREVPFPGFKYRIKFGTKIITWFTRREKGKIAAGNYKQSLERRASSPQDRTSSTAQGCAG